MNNKVLNDWYKTLRDKSTQNVVAEFKATYGIYNLFTITCTDVNLYIKIKRVVNKFKLSRKIQRKKKNY